MSGGWVDANNYVNGNVGDDGVATSAQLNGPKGIAVDGSGTYVYISDTGNNRVRLVTIGVANNIISNYAGQSAGAVGPGGDLGAATSAYLTTPYQISLDTSNNLYIADSLNYVVRVVNAGTHIISRVAGTGASCSVPTAAPTLVTGPATNYCFISPKGVVVDNMGMIYMSDTSKYVITRAMNPLPTGQPTLQPTQQPSSRPSRQPTMQPSGDQSPCFLASFFLSFFLSFLCKTLSFTLFTCIALFLSFSDLGQPSQQPSRQPTSQPTMQPSRLPTAQPSRQPTNQPTGMYLILLILPVSLPSSSSFSRYSSFPSLPFSTGRPSRMPSSQPTLQPFNHPSARPSLQPFSRPSTQPTIQPTNAPSNPSSQPTNEPTHPTPVPTMEPSSPYPTASPNNQVFNRIQVRASQSNSHTPVKYLSQILTPHSNFPRICRYFNR